MSGGVVVEGFPQDWREVAELDEVVQVAVGDVNKTIVARE